MIGCLERMPLCLAAGEADKGSGSDGGGSGVAAASPSRGRPQDIIAQAPPRRAGDLDIVADTRPQMLMRTAIQRWQVGAAAGSWVQIYLVIMLRAVLDLVGLSQHPKNTHFSSSIDALACIQQMLTVLAAPHAAGGGRAAAAGGGHQGAAGRHRRRGPGPHPAPGQFLRDLLLDKAFGSGSCCTVDPRWLPLPGVHRCM